MISTDWKPEFYHWRIREEEGVVAADDTIGEVKNAKKYPAVKVEILFEKYKHVNMLKYEWREMLECEGPASCQEITGQWIRMFQLSDARIRKARERERGFLSLAGANKNYSWRPESDTNWSFNHNAHSFMHCHWCQYGFKELLFSRTDNAAW